MEMIAKIVAAAIIIEAIIEYFSIFCNKEFSLKCWMSLGFGIIFAVLYGIDLLYVFGLETGVPFVGMVLTGILLSRGSNYVADIIKKVGKR